MNNRKVRKALFAAEIKQYQLAELLGVTESRVSKMLRTEMPLSEQNRIVEIIRKRMNDNE